MRIQYFVGFSFRHSVHPYLIWLSHVYLFQGPKLEESEKARKTVRKYQEKQDSSSLSLAEHEDLCDKLGQIRSKASYQLDVTTRLFAAALDGNDLKVALKAFGSGWILDSIVNSHLEVNSWDFVLKSQFVAFGDQIVLFPT